jgi:hypothetical protein
MVSLLHEGVIKLVRDCPEFAADLLGRLLDVEVPRFTEARIADATLNELVPVEYRADAVVVFTKNKPVFGAIIEAQLKPDGDKRFTWPLYAAGAREHHRCPFVVIVVTPDPKTARWAARTIDLGGGNRYLPLVIGPDGIPKLTDPRRARREPQLAVLSVMAHGRGKVKTAAAIGTAAARAILPFPEDQRLLYSLLIEANLSEAARKAIEMQPGLETFFSETQRRNYERGRAKGRAEARAEAKAEGKAQGVAAALLKILMRRGLALTAEQRRRITGCTDLAVLERWLDRSLSVSSAEELFAVRSRARRSVRPHGRRAPGGGSRRKSR